MIRNATDFTLTKKEMKRVIGFTTKKDKNFNNLRNRTLYRLYSRLSSPAKMVYAIGQKLANDRHVLIASLFCSWGADIYLIVNITSLKIARELITMDWRAYTKLPTHLANNAHLAMLAIQQHVQAYNYLPSELQQDYRIVHYVISRMDGIYRNLDNVLKQDRELIRLAIKRNPINYKYVPVIVRELFCICNMFSFSAYRNL